MNDQPSPTEDEPWWAPGLTPKPGGNPPEIPPDYLYDPESNLYWSPQRPGFIPPRTTPPVIDRRVLPNGEIVEWERPRSIPDDFIYDPEIRAYYPPGSPTDEEYQAHMEEMRRRFAKTIEEVRKEPPIPPEQLVIPPGTFYVPPAMRKSLSDKGGRRRRSRRRDDQRDLFSDLPDDDESAT